MFHDLYSLDGTIKLWDTTSFEIKKTIINSPNNSWVMDLVHLPLSNQIAAVSMDGIVNVYNPSSWKLNSQFMNKGYILGENLCKCLVYKWIAFNTWIWVPKADCLAFPC